MKLVLVLLATVSGVAFACPAGPTVDQLTCAQAQNFVDANGCYWEHTPNGNYDISPVLPFDQVNCRDDQRVTDVYDATLDNSECVLGYQCRPGK